MYCDSNKTILFKDSYPTGPDPIGSPKENPVLEKTVTVRRPHEVVTQVQRNPYFKLEVLYRLIQVVITEYLVFESGLRIFPV